MEFVKVGDDIVAAGKAIKSGIDIIKKLLQQIADDEFVSARGAQIAKAQLGMLNNGDLSGIAGLIDESVESEGYLDLFAELEVSEQNNIQS